MVLYAYFQRQELYSLLPCTQGDGCLPQIEWDGTAESPVLDNEQVYCSIPGKVTTSPSHKLVASSSSRILNLTHLFIAILTSLFMDKLSGPRMIRHCFISSKMRLNVHSNYIASVLIMTDLMMMNCCLKNWMIYIGVG